jgi:serine/threonine protein phosphatase PrpC
MLGQKNLRLIGNSAIARPWRAAKDREETHIMKVAAKSDRGRVRKSNEDCLLVDESLGLLIVADGMGGHAGGEVASALAVEAVAAYVRAHLIGSEPADHTAALLLAAFRTANEAIRIYARRHRQLRHMGTTVVLALCQGDQVHIAHVGDSRAYLLRHGELCQLTEDHSVVAQMIAAGQLTPDEARSHPLRHLITRYLGGREATADIHGLTWQRGDYLLLCSDGLTTMVEDRHIAELILQSGANIQAACEALVARANANGGEDNVSVVLAYKD